jgi:serine/threonine protein kinase
MHIIYLLLFIFNFITKSFLFSLHYIHKNNFIHRDIHSGNILLSTFWQIGDLGLLRPANNSSPNDEIYGVIPYIAPEIFKGGVFSEESDIYSLGMVMWELTTGCKPFANVEHDVDLIYEIVDGKRPEITQDTPECFTNLMKKCWDSNPSNRPTVTNIYFTVYEWSGLNNEANFTTEDKIIVKVFKQAEEKRLELIQSKKLGPEFSKKSHSKAIYTSRALSSLISKYSTINSYSINSFNAKQGMSQHIIYCL